LQCILLFCCKWSPTCHNYPDEDTEQDQPEWRSSFLLFKRALYAEWYRYTKGRYSPVPHYLNCKRCHSVTQK